MLSMDRNESRDWHHNRRCLAGFGNSLDLIRVLTRVRRRQEQPVCHRLRDHHILINCSISQTNVICAN